jgi:hypothetical protein
MSHRSWSPIFSGLACAALLGAAPANLISQTPPASETRKIVVIGCLKQAQGGAEFTLTDVRGGPTPTFRLDGKDPKLTPWVGQTLEIAGTVAGGAPGGSSTMNAPRLTVDTVTRISVACMEPPAQPKSGN